MAKLISILKRICFGFCLYRIVVVFLFVLGHFLIAMASSDDVAASEPTPKKMGIEIETSAIKVSSAGTDKIGFTIFNALGNEWIAVEEDTSDVTFKGVDDFKSFNKNLECKTVGGFDRDDLLTAVAHIENILQRLHADATSEPVVVTQEMLMGFIGDAALEVIPRCEKLFCIKSKPDDDVIRPQITYQLPFEEIFDVFCHLGSLGHSSIKGFLHIMDPSVSLKLPDLSALDGDGSGAETAFIEDMKATQILKTFFHDEIAPVFSAITNPKLKGFCCLFFYYWYELFNNNKLVIKEHEPGLKQFLGVMSRISFSELYDSLDPRDKTELQSILHDIVVSHGSRFRLKYYKDYDFVPINSTLTLAEWYRSIVDSSARRYGVDFLSPPPGLPDSDSMGFFRLEKTEGFPLIEVRGYVSLAPSIRINKTIEFAETEANWFFNISKKRK